MKDGQATILPDGSAFMTMSLPLPEDHWLTQPGDNHAPPMSFRRGTDHPTRKEWAEKIRDATRYALRASTANGTIEDYDPDAVVQNMIVAMLGYWTPDGLSPDDIENPTNPPPLP